tara:strand:+ start:4084 stop:7842 length:3759 start_codon:yes stop_codon:yes gene_type:complete
MVEYTLEVDFGQSNATAIGDIQGWEDNHPDLAIRSPNTERDQAKKFGTGPEQDKFTMPATFKGAPQTSLLGDETSGSFQTVSLRGVATDAVRVATFYNPCATFSTTNAHAKDAPGTYRVLASSNLLVPNTAREFSTNLFIQPGRTTGTAAAISAEAAGVLTTSAAHGLVANDIVVFKGGAYVSASNPGLGLENEGPFKILTVPNPDEFTMETWPEGEAHDTMTYAAGATVHKVNNTDSPKQVTRSRTGSVHTYAPTAVGLVGNAALSEARLVVDPPFMPAPDADESFELEVALQQAPSTSSDPLVLDMCLGGLVGGATAVSGNTSIRQSASGGYLMLQAFKHPLRRERPFALTRTGLFSSTPFGAVVDSGAPTTILVTGGGVFEVDDYLVADDGGVPATFPAELTSGDSYYVVSVVDAGGGVDDIEIALTKGGAAISFATSANIAYLNFDMGALSAGVNYWPTRQPEAVLTPFTLTPLSTFLLIPIAQEFLVDEKIRISYDSGATPITELPAGDYYVTSVTPTAGTELLTLSATKGGSAIAISASGSGVIEIERLDAYTTWFVSEDRGGVDIQSSTSQPAVRQEAITFRNADVFAGSLSGLRIRCLSGANVGQWKHGKHISYDSTNDLTSTHFDGSWTSTPAADDTFVIEPTPVGDEERSYDEFCQLLPWCPWEGRARGSRSGGPSTVTIQSGSTTTEITPQGFSAPDRTSVVFYTTGVLPNGLIAGKTYFVNKCASTSTFVSETYGGDAMLQTADAGSGTHYMEAVDNDLGDNPFPPGFNYPSQFSTPRNYMAYDGVVVGSFYSEQTSQQASGMSAGLQLAHDLHNYTGRRTLYVNCAFGGTSIAHKEVHPTTTGGSTHGWYDGNQLISWAAGETNNCYGRLLAVLRGVKLALTEEQSTIAEVVIHFNQGEEDATQEYHAASYRQNLKRLKAMVRQAIYDLGLSPVAANRIKFIHAKIKEISQWEHAATVNGHIVDEANSDPFSRYLDVSDLEVHADRDVFEGSSSADAVHYHGSQMDLLGKRAFVAYKAMERAGYSETQVANMALTYLGEPGRLTNIDTDTSREAELCRQFLPIARDELLESHAWDFALCSTTLTVRTASPRVDWKYAYDYPEDVASVLDLVRSDVDYNYKTMGTTGQHEYSVELDINADRVILTDLEDALMLYVAKVTDPSKWSTKFITALAWRMVFHMAGGIVKGEEGAKKAAMAMQMADRIARAATKHDADHKRNVNVSDHVPKWLAHRSNPGPFRR